MSRLGPGSDFPYQVKDPVAFARNMTRMAEAGGRALAALSQSRRSVVAPHIFSGDFAPGARTLSRIAEIWLSNPYKMAEAQTSLWTGCFSLWMASLQRMSGTDSGRRPPTHDRRFADPSWSEHPMFDFMSQAYLFIARWAEDLIERTEDIDEQTRRNGLFHVRQITNALAPSNFVLTNPELLRETLETSGENLARGMEMLAEDLEASGGELTIRHSDPRSFELGRDLATTPGKIVWQNELMQLIQYAPSTETVFKRPLLVVPPWINKFYVLDLTPEKSLVRWMIDQGHTVFLISWVNPDHRLAGKSFEDYMREGVLEATDAIRTATGEKRINAMGYCVGGTLLAATAAWLAAKGNNRIASATLLTAQVDFVHAGDLKVFVDEAQIEALEEEMSRTGYLEGRRLAGAFNLLRANDLIWPYVINNYLRGRAPAPFDILHWNSDSTRMPAANHSFYLRYCYLENRLSRGEMEIAGVTLDLGRVKVPIYNLATRDDHIAPARSVFVGSRVFGSPVRYVMAGSGHIAGVINSPSRNKYQYWTGGRPTGTLEDWLAGASEHAGSWWPDWQAWIEKRSGKTRVPAREPGGGKLKIIEDAPGSYVMVKD